MVWFNEWEEELSLILQPARKAFLVQIAMLPDEALTTVEKIPQFINILFPKSTGSNESKDGQMMLEYVGIEINLEKRYKDNPAINNVVSALIRTLSGYRLKHSRSGLFLRDRTLFKPFKGVWKSEITYSFTWYLDYSLRPPILEEPKVTQVNQDVITKIHQIQEMYGTNQNQNNG